MHHKGGKLVEQSVIIIGINGPSASGKSLMANTIVEQLGSSKVAVIAEDSYYRDLRHMTMEERNQVNFDHPDAMDHELLLSHLKQLRRGDPVEVPHYDYASHARTEQTTRVHNHQIIVLEGILLFSDQRLREQMDIRIFMESPLDTCLIRRLRRDTQQRGRSVESVLKAYEQQVRPMYLQFIEPSKRYADIIVPRGGKNTIAIDLIKTKMRQLLDCVS